jgi:hypothetical protein
MIQPITGPTYPQKKHHCDCNAQPSYNAVKIDIHNPAVNVPSNQQQEQQIQYLPEGMLQNQNPNAQYNYAVGQNQINTTNAVSGQNIPSAKTNAVGITAVDKQSAQAVPQQNLETSDTSGKQTAQTGYAPVTNPYYNYPQSSIYECPACPPCPSAKVDDEVALDAKMLNAGADEIIKEANELLAKLAAEKAAIVSEREALEVARTQQPPTIIQQNINAPVDQIPEPKIIKDDKKTQALNEAEIASQEIRTDAPIIEEAVSVTPQVDLNAFLAKLSDSDFEVQAASMEAIASLIKEDPQLATKLLDEKVVNSLRGIIKNDSSKLEGPNADQVAARRKLLSGQKLTDAEAQLANVITPMEQSERNKSYAMFTLAMMQKLYGDEVKKLTNSTVPLTELPAAADIVEQLATNPNPMVRISALEALSYIKQPEYKDDLKALFKVAINDKDNNVQEAAKAAMASLDAA